MNRAPKSWLLPTAFVAYVALASARDAGGWAVWFALLAPVGVAIALRWVAARSEAGLVATSVEGIRLTIIGIGLYTAALTGSKEDAVLRAASGVAQGLITAGALLAIARLASPPGILQGHPAARSLDVLALSVVLWTTASAAALFRALAPDVFPLDPIALDTAYLFAALGSLLLLCVSLIRTRVLRGLELGVGDRATAGLALAVCGTLVGAGSGFVKMASSDRLAGATLVATASSIVLALAVRDATRVSRTVRGFVALLLLGAPTALGGAWLSMHATDHAAPVALTLAAASMAVGLLAHRAARPLAPEGSRWLMSLTQAMDAALHPEPDMALRAALLALRKAEPASQARPEVFRFDPPGMLSVDIAGYLNDKPGETPEKVVETALDEPHRTLRWETLRAAQVRIPRVRPLVTWFEAHGAKTATVLSDEAGPIGILVLPRGRRKSPLTTEEAELLGRLAQRLAGLISVTASLRRARTRELDFQKQARAADARATTLTEQLAEQRRADRLEAENRVEVLRAAAHSPAAQIKRQEIEENALSPRLRLRAPLGVDPVPWAAHAHLARGEEPRPLVILDCSERSVRTQAPWNHESEVSPWRRAEGGTLVVLHPGTLPEEAQLRLAEGLEGRPPELVVSCSTGPDHLVPRLTRQLEGPLIELPTLSERGEDLQALVISELAHLGMTMRGEPLGIERAALYRLVQRSYPGNDAELRGILASAAGNCRGARITLDDLEGISRTEESDLPPLVTQARTRARVAPRTRRR